MKSFHIFLLCLLVGLSAAKVDDKSVEVEKEDEDGSGEEYVYDDEDNENWVGFGSGDYEDEEELDVSLVQNEPKKNNNDFTFEDSNNEEDELYEYNNEYYEEEYEDEEEVEDEKESHIEVLILDNDGQNHAEPFFKLSYLYIMMASAILSFVLVLLSVVICRRWQMDKRRKQIMQQRQNGPYFLPSADSFKHQSPIVKNYQRVPTSSSTSPSSYLTATTAVNMNAKYDNNENDDDASEKKLLDRLYT